MQKSAIQCANKSSMMSMWLSKHTVLLRCDSTMSRRVDSDRRNNSLRVEPVLRAIKPPAKSNKPRDRSLPDYHDGFLPLPLPLSLLLALASRSQPPHPPPIPLVVLLIWRLPSSLLLRRDRPARVLDRCAGVGTSYIDLLRRRMGFSGISISYND
ncbi:hypothetical protein MUK42_07954 [Musa troglodytarum]|uniref:Uncharacterized protein n=1 Tax=Musa troglodytarum TaxID=320322 RepID=A0A9E7JB56_9LILI|nr:hypothetical protein MUK42_07954 [Musa troglodytarum]